MPHPKERCHDNTSSYLWCGVLRYLTGGKEFCGPTTQFDELDQDQRQFLTVRCGPGSEVSFFGVWMSRDLIYVAPKDAQEALIQEWIKWYKTEGIYHEYSPARDVDWYF